MKNFTTFKIHNAITKYQLFLALTIGLFCNTIFAQTTIIGEVKDSNGNLLEGVNIILNPSYYGATTTVDGQFKLKNIPLGTYTLSVSYIGYKTIHDTIKVTDKEQSLSFVLPDDLLSLQNVVVTGTFKPKVQLESSTSNSVLNSKMIEQVYPQGTANLLQSIPGTFVDASAGEVFTKIYTRGVSASAEDDMGWYYVSLQEDGLPVSLVQYSYFSPDLFHRLDLSTEKVEALRGGSASVTALNAPGGIYNFISSDAKNKFSGNIKLTNGLQGENNYIHKIDATVGSPLGNNWFINMGGHYRIDDGARNTSFTFSKGGQFKLNVIKRNKHGYFKFYGKLLDDYTNRYTGVAAVNWEDPTPAFGQDFSSTSLLMPSFNAKIPDGRNLTQGTTNSFDPSQGVHAKDLAFGFDISQDLGNNWSFKNNLKFSTKSANWQSSISNAFVSLDDPLAYFISGADFPIGQVVFKDAKTGSEIARVDNSGMFTGQPFQYLSDGTLPNDAIMGTAAWYIENEADEWMNLFTLHKKLDNHNITGGIAFGFSDVSFFNQGSFGYVTYEPNPKMLQVTLENPNEPIIALSDANGISNYGGLFFVNSEANVSQLATFFNDDWKITDNVHLDFGLRYESIKHKGSKDRYAPFSQDGGLDANNNTAYDNSILAPTGEADKFNFNYNYLSYSAGLNYKLNTTSAFFIRFSQGNKAPELNYYFNNFANVPIHKKGTVQKINQLELGAKYSQRNFSFTSTLFWSELKNIGTANFEFDSDDNSIFYTPILFNTSRTLGLEWESAYEPFKNITFRFNGVLQNPKATKWKIYDAAGTVDTNDDVTTDYSGNTLAFNPKLMTNVTSEYNRKKISAFLKWQFMGKRYGNVANAFELPSYSIFNLGAGYKINNHLSANILVSNLFNSKGLTNFYGANSFGASANGATSDYINANPDESFVVFPVLRRRALIELSYQF